MTTDKTAVRTRIVDAALHLLETTGIRGVAQPRVAKVAGVFQGHLTYYFPKRHDLLEAVTDRFVELLRAELPAEIVPLFSRRKAAMVFVRKLVKNRARTRTLLGLVVAADEDPALRKRLVDNAGRLRKLVAGFVDRDVEDSDVDIVLATLWGLGLMHLILDERDEETTVARVERFEEWLDTMIEKRRAPVQDA